MRKEIFSILPFLVLILGSTCEIDARKVKNTLRIEKDKAAVEAAKQEFEGKMIILSDSLSVDPLALSHLKNVKFAGYEKEPNAAVESFILINPTEKHLTGYEVKIDYLDMKGRMLHSRTLKQRCIVPGGETRKIDINSWDKQHTYYYYLGNEPKRVATPYQVKFTPLALWIKDE